MRLPAPRRGALAPLAPLAVLAVLAVACTTPYRPMDRGGAYTDYRQDDSTYVVAVRVNGFTRAEQATAYFERRASEICGQQGHRSYRLVQETPGAPAPIVASVAQAGTVASPENALVTGDKAGERVGRIRCTDGATTTSAR